MSQKKKGDIATEAWGLMFNILVRSNPERSAAIAARDLSPNDSRALWQLGQETGQPIGALAKSWGCDPSNATFIIDRLVKAGLAARREDQRDRRVRLVFLTPEGERVKQELLAEFHRPPQSFSGLTTDELRLMVSLLKKLDAASANEI